MSLQEYISQQFVGQDKSKQQILNDIYKAAKDANKDKLGYIPLKPMALITVHDPHSSIIESIGFSEPDDLLLDNWGAAFSGMFNDGGFYQRNLVDELGVVYTVNMTDTLVASGSQFTRQSPIAGTLMKVGRGGVITRSDFDLTDPFVVAPESNFFNLTTPGGWVPAVQQVLVNALLTNVTTSDSIGECGLYMKWNTSGFTDQQFMISHDAAGASFNSGQNVNVTYTWSIF